MAYPGVYRPIGNEVCLVPSCSVVFHFVLIFSPLPLNISEYFFLSLSRVYRCVQRCTAVYDYYVIIANNVANNCKRLQEIANRFKSLYLSEFITLALMRIDGANSQTKVSEKNGVERRRVPYFIVFYRILYDRPYEQYSLNTYEHV